MTGESQSNVVHISNCLSTLPRFKPWPAGACEIVASDLRIGGCFPPVSFTTYDLLLTASRNISEKVTKTKISHCIDSEWCLLYAPRAYSASPLTC